MPLNTQGGGSWQDIMNSFMPILMRAQRAALCASALLIPLLLVAQEFEMDWYAVTAGGGEASGGDFTLSATVGQPEAGDMAGGDFALTSGFWSIVPATEPPPALSLNVRLDAGHLIISWPETGGAGFLLEQASALAAPGGTWDTVNVTPQTSNGIKTVRIPLTVGSRFYRLHQP
jgi:hypothetical protein